MKKSEKENKKQKLDSLLESQDEYQSKDNRQQQEVTF